MAAEVCRSATAVDLLGPPGYPRPMRASCFLLLALGCTGPDEVERSGDPTAGTPAAVSLAYTAPAALDLPPTSRSQGAPAKRWRVRGQWAQTRAEDGREEYAVRVPYRLVFYGQQGGAKPEGMRLQIDKRKGAQFEGQRKSIGKPGTWGLKKNKLIVRRAQGEGPPEKVWVKVPGATSAERSLNMDTADLTPERFAFRTIDRRQSTTHGVFLPAPGSVSWKLKVPQRARLDLDAELLTPPVRAQGRSDGAEVVVSVDAGQGDVEVLRAVLSPGKRQDLRADLTQWAGQQVSLSIRTEPGVTAELDYVFLGDPVLHSPKDEPRRALVVFVDTLRQDHLGTYGYGRPTSPNIDALADESVVFTRAWAPSPWTLPSALAAAYGRAPEDVDGHAHIGEMLSAKGWATCAVVSNNWLNAPDTLGAGWGEHRAVRGANAQDQAKRARRCLKRYPDRDLLLFVHFIDPHFPYMESGAFQGRFASEAPAGLPEKIRHTHAKAAWAAAQSDAERGAIRQHLIDRYDQNILAVDAAVKRLLRAVGDSAVVALFSDHGEEFWEHGGFEHGHTLYEELVQVPMMIRAPGLSPARIDVPVTLKDLVPTLGPFLGIDSESAAQSASGASGIDVMRIVGAESEAGSRPIDLGRVLFGDAQWAVVSSGKKWVTRADQQTLYDLGADPGETQDLAKGANLEPWPEQLSMALGQRVERVIRIAGPGAKRQMSGGKSELMVRHPQGLAATWTRIDPHGSLADPVLSEGVVTVATAKGQKAPREIFVRLAEGAPVVGLQVQWKHAGAEHLGTVGKLPAEGPLLTLGGGASVMQVAWAWQPIPRGEGVRYAGEVTEEMRALGYIE